MRSKSRPAIERAHPRHRTRGWPGREDRMSDINDEVLQADPRDFALAVNAKPFNVFYYKTPHLLEYVLEPGYFNSIFETAIRRHDRIELVANSGGVAEHATLAVR